MTDTSQQNTRASSSTDVKNTVSLWTSVRNNSVNLSLIALLMAGILAVVYQLTSERIDANLRQARLDALIEVMPTHYFDEDLLNYSIAMPNPEQLFQTASSTMYVAKKSGKMTGWIIPVTTREGYAGPIDLIVGIDINGTVVGARVISHQETPGLGDKIDRKKSDWIDSFQGKNFNNAVWAVQKNGGDFDQFTGATITPRAVVNAIADALRYAKQHHQALLALANTSVNNTTDEAQ